MKIAGTVVLYNPEENLLENINTYLPLIDTLYVMDNSTKSLEIIEKVKNLEKVKYISLDGNKGIAKALKVATETAIDDGFDFILSMDQDSKFPTQDFSYIKNYIENNDISNIGLFAVNYDDSHILVKSDDKNYVEKINFCITSGTVLVLENYKKIDGFNEDLFIDLVDYDVCCQYYEKDIEMLMFVNIKLNHKLGKILHVKFLSYEKDLVVHSRLRYYYMYRNFYYLLNHKSDKYVSLLKTKAVDYSGKFIFRRFLFEKPRFKILKMIKKGIKHGKKGILGPYQEKNK